MMEKKANGSILELIKKHPGVIAFVVLACIFPLIVREQYFQRMLIEIYFIGAMACAWNIIGGFANQTSWAHAGFMAIGAYTSYLMFLRLNISPFISMFVGVAIAIVVAIIIGAPTFKLRGTFFTIASIACGTVIRQCLLYPAFTDLTGGANGLVIPMVEKESFWNLQFLTEIPFYYISLVLLLITLIVISFIVRSRLGYSLQAIKEDQDAAESLGIRSHRVKLIALVISAAMMSVLGTMYSFKIRYIDPQSVSSYDVAVRIGITAIIGGLGTEWGPVLGAFITIPLLEVANYFFAAMGGGGAGFAIYGVLMIVVVLFEPGGLLAVWKKLVRTIKGASAKAKKQTG